MTGYKLYYARARGEVQIIQLIFATAGTKYDDIQLDDEQVKTFARGKFYQKINHSFLYLIYDCCGALTHTGSRLYSAESLPLWNVQNIFKSLVLCIEWYAVQT